MPKITYPNKVLGDQFFAEEATEIKDVVNAIDDLVAALQSGKIDSTTFIAAMALKANTADVTTALAGKLGITGPIYAGSTTGSSLGFGGGYLAFNGKRNDATGVWTFYTDGGTPAHNAGAIIFLNIAAIATGKILKIIEIPTAGDGSTNQTFTDSQIAALPDYLDHKAGKDLAINSQAGNYTLALSDRAVLVNMQSASPCTVTLPSDSVPFPIGSQVPIDWGNAAGQPTIMAGSGATVQSEGDKFKISAKFNGIIAHKIAANTWRIKGALV